MRLKIIFITLALLCWIDRYSSQTESSFISIQKGHLYNPYLFYDLVREAGLGCEIRRDLRFSMDVRLGYIIPNASILKKLDVNDYFMMKGFDISAIPKWQLKNHKNNYIGLWFSFQKSQYSNRVVEDKYSNMGNFSFSNSPWLINSPSETIVRSRKSEIFIVGLSYGLKFFLGSIQIEQFANAGLGFVSSTSNVKKVVNSPSYNESNQKLGGSANLGLKIGFGIKKLQLSDKYLDLITELNEDVAYLVKIADSLHYKQQISNKSHTQFKKSINDLMKITQKSIIGNKEPLEINFIADEHLVSIIKHLKDHTYKKGAYANSFIYKKPNGRMVEIKPHEVDLFDIKDRIVNYPDLILSNEEKENLFSSFYTRIKNNPTN